MLDISVAEKAYLAAFVDGEGSFTITSQVSSGGRRFHYLDASVSNSNHAALLSLQAVWGGYLNTNGSVRRPSRLPMWKLSWKNRHAIPVLTAILPYMRIKQAQARLALQFAERLSDRSEEGVTPKFSGRRRMPVEEVEERNRLQAMMYDLNAITRSGTRSRTPVPDSQMVALGQRTCKGCGITFVPDERVQVFHDGECRARTLKHESYMRNGDRWTQAAKERRIDKRVLRTTCVSCGTPMTTTSARQQYCSGACNQRAFRARHKE